MSGTGGGLTLSNRYAKTTDVDAEGTVLRNEDGSKSQIGSGFMSRAGLTVYLGRSSGEGRSW